MTSIHLPENLTDLHFSKPDKDFHSPIFHFIHPFLTLTGIEHVNSPGGIKARRVSAVGGYGKHNDDSKITTPLIGCFCGMFFGALHCLGWKYLFQTESWAFLWRASSAVIAISPVLLLLSFGYYHLWSSKYKYKTRTSISVADVFLIFLVVLIFFTYLIYIIARILLLVLMMLSFLSLPPSAYDTVAWTRFLPHL